MNQTAMTEQADENPTPQKHRRHRRGPSFRGEMDRVLGRFFDDVDVSSFPWSRWGAAPRIDVSETDDTYEVKADLPGVEEKDIDLTLSRGTLTIKGERKSEKEEKDKNFVRVERDYGAFERIVALGDDIDEDKISASHDKGVLTVTMAKKPEAKAETKTIEVTSQ
jgi:HSP20 family protein